MRHLNAIYRLSYPMVRRVADWRSGILVALIASTCGGQTFQGIGRLPTHTGSIVSDMTPDGRFVIGTSHEDFFADQTAFIWSQATGMTALEDLPSEFGSHWAIAVSDDGTVIAGNVLTSNGEPQGFRWTTSGGLTVFGQPPGSLTDIFVSDLSANGNEIIGSWQGQTGCQSPQECGGFVWNEQSGFVELTSPRGGVVYPQGISADGSMVVGSESGDGTLEAFLLTESNGTVYLGDLPGGDIQSQALEVSSDGSVVVGRSSAYTGSEAFMWTANDGMIGLGNLPGGNDTGGIDGSAAYGVSQDGTYVVGIADGLPPFGDDAFIWSSATGMQNIRMLLAASGADMAGWRLLDAVAVSTDGRIVAGSGRNPAGDYEGWIATIPEPPAADFNGDTLLDCADIDPLVSSIANGSNDITFDLTSDGLVNADDLTEWLRVAGLVINFITASPILPGDANLDGFVDGTDFGIWNSHKFTSAGAWCSGDFSTDGVIDGSDFGIWNSHKFAASDGSLVPEPSFIGRWVVAVGMVIIMSGRGYYRCRPSFHGACSADPSQVAD